MIEHIPSKQCKCGYIHPSPWDDNCPIINSKKLGESEKGQKIQKICSKLSSFLDSKEDYEKIINAVETLIEKMKRV